MLRHPAVTAAIIGPRTMDHLESQLTAADIELSDDVLDRIDEIVSPGTTINVADNGWTQTSITDTATRRRYERPTPWPTQKGHRHEHHQKPRRHLGCAGQRRAVRGRVMAPNPTPSAITTSCSPAASPR